MSCKYTYEQWREISNAIGDAMQYAHDRAIEHPDKADPLWNLDEYVNRVMVTAFGGSVAGPVTGEKIVRCRDCKRFSLDNSDHDYRSGWWCHRWNTDMVKPDGFCAWGKRRDA